MNISSTIYILKRKKHNQIQHDILSNLKADVQQWWKFVADTTKLFFLNFVLISDLCLIILLNS